MIHRPASSQPRPAGRGIPRTRRTLTAPQRAGSPPDRRDRPCPRRVGNPLPPAEPVVPPPPPPPPPPAAAAAHFPLWAVIAIVAATVVLSVATTLITLSLEHRRRARRTPAAVAEPQAGMQIPSTTAEPEPSRARSSQPPARRPGMTCHEPTAGEGRTRRGSRWGP